MTTAKSPMEMFPLEIDNDLKAVDTAIREYYGLAANGTPVKKKEEQKDGSSLAAKVAGVVEKANKIPEG